MPSLSRLIIARSRVSRREIISEIFTPPSLPGPGCSVDLGRSSITIPRRSGARRYSRRNHAPDTSVIEIRRSQYAIRRVRSLRGSARILISLRVAAYRIFRLRKNCAWRDGFEVPDLYASIFSSVYNIAAIEPFEKRRARRE